MAEFCFCTGNLQEPSFKTTVEKMTPTDNYEQVFGNISFGHGSCDLLVLCGHTSLTRKLLSYLLHLIMLHLMLHLIMIT